MLKIAFWKIRIRKIIKITIGIVKKTAKIKTTEAPTSIKLTHEKRIIDLIRSKIAKITKKIGKIDIFIARNNKRNATIKSNNPSILTSILKFKSKICLNNLWL